MNEEEIINELQNNKIVILPTDGIFGIFTKEHNISGINEIYQIKNRDQCKKLCIYTNDFPFKETNIIGMTYIYKNTGYRSSKIHKSLENIINKVGNLVGTSCNSSNYPPITNLKHINFNIPVLQKECLLGLESTIFSLDTNTILRSGYVQTERIIFNNKFIFNIESNKAYDEEYECSYLVKNFWNWVNTNKSINFNIVCKCYHCSLINHYLNNIN